MKMMVEIQEVQNGHVELRCDVPPGMCTAREKAYMEELVAAIRAAAPHFGKTRGAKAIVWGENAKPENQ